MFSCSWATKTRENHMQFLQNFPYSSGHGDHIEGGPPLPSNLPTAPYKVVISRGSILRLLVLTCHIYNINVGFLMMF